eukprot:gene35623-45615_t
MPPTGSNTSSAAVATDAVNSALVGVHASALQLPRTILKATAMGAGGRNQPLALHSILDLLKEEADKPLPLTSAAAAALAQQALSTSKITALLTLPTRPATRYDITTPSTTYGDQYAAAPVYDTDAVGGPAVPHGQLPPYYIVDPDYAAPPNSYEHSYQTYDSATAAAIHSGQRHAQSLMLFQDSSVLSQQQLQQHVVGDGDVRHRRQMVAEPAQRRDEGLEKGRQTLPLGEVARVRRQFREHGQTGRGVFRMQ